MKTRNKQMQRIVYFLDEVKKGNHPNAHTFVEKLKSLDARNETSLACSEKTIKRDIQYLTSDMAAPVEYDPSEKGYYLWNPEWSLPEVTLSADELFAELFVKKISEEHLLPCLREHLNAGTDIQMRATDQSDINIPALASLIHVTGQHKDVDEESSEKILEAWRECRQLKTLYRKSPSDPGSKRKLDIHALFLSNGIWYCRAYCHERKDFRSFALHKFSEVEVMKKRFKRSKEVVESLQKGHFFDFTQVKDVRVYCSANFADYIQDREWFPGQTTQIMPDGRVELHFDHAPERALVWWVMSFGGELELVEPAYLRDEVLGSAKRIGKLHQ